MREQFEKEYRELLTNGLKNNPLRLEYEQKVRELSVVRERLFREGYATEQIAQILHARRRELGVIYKDAAPPLFREYIWYATAQKYGDPLGPDYESLRSRKTLEQIIESASRPIEDLNNRLTLDGFKRWFEEQYTDQVTHHDENQNFSRRQGTI